MSALIPRAAAARLLAALVLAILPGAGAAVAAQASGGDSSAVAVNTKDGSSVFKLTFAIRNVVGDTVDNQNAAVAYASCTACQTVAISIQVLLVQGDPSTFTPENVAIALNENCTLCDTLAFAYQFAVGVGTRLRFTGQGRQDLAEIRRELRELQDSGLSGADLAARVDALMTRLGEVLGSQLVPVRRESPDPRGPAYEDGEHTPQEGAEPESRAPSDPDGEQSDPYEPAPTETGPEPPPATSTTPDDGGDPEPGTTETTPDGDSGSTPTPTSP